MRPRPHRRTHRPHAAGFGPAEQIRKGQHMRERERELQRVPRPKLRGSFQSGKKMCVREAEFEHLGTTQGGAREGVGAEVCTAQTRTMCGASWWQSVAGCSPRPRPAHSRHTVSKAANGRSPAARIVASSPACPSPAARADAILPGSSRISSSFTAPSPSTSVKTVRSPPDRLASCSTCPANKTYGCKGIPKEIHPHLLHLCRNQIKPRLPKAHAATE